MKKTRMLFSTFAVIALILAGLANPSPARANIPIHYAAPGGLTSGTCDTWGTACELRYLLTVPSVVSGDEVWVKAGVYKPTDNAANQLASFVMPPQVAVYGGFAGTEVIRDDRNPATRVTILSGDIDSNDINADGNHIDETWADIVGTNSAGVVTMDGTGLSDVTSLTVLDGVVVTGGDAGIGYGAGLYCEGTGAGSVCSPTLANLTFSGNRAGYGAAMYNRGRTGGVGSPTVQRVTFTGNRATEFGGAVLNDGSSGTSSPMFTDVTFSGNQAAHLGGAIYNVAGSAGNSHSTFTNVTFAGNSVSSGSGGAISTYALGGSGSMTFANVAFVDNSASSDGGGIYDWVGDGTISSTFTNVTFHGNSATNGGALSSSVSTGTSNTTYTNVIMWGDTATNGPEFFNGGAAPTFSYSIVQGSGGSASWDTSLGTDGGNNLDADPLLGPLAYNGGYTQTMAIPWASPAVEAGTLLACPGTDQRGLARPQGLTCDIGAYEAAAFVISGNAGGDTATLGYVAGVPRSAVADGLGNYEFAVPAGWSGTVKPFKSGYDYSPRLRNYTNVTADQVNQDYTQISLPSGGPWDDSYPEWTYAGAWAPITGSGPYLNTLHVGAAPGATATFAFWGNGFNLVYLQYTNWGRIGVYLDGSATPLTTINTNGPAGLPTYNSPGLIPGPHTVTLKHDGPAGSFIAIDLLEPRTPLTLLTGTFDGGGSGWSPTGTWLQVGVPDLYSGTLHIGIVPYSTSTMFVYGTQFTLTYLKYTNWGNIAIFLDGNSMPLAVINTNGAAALPTYTSPKLPLGEHVVMLVHAGPAGSFIGIDGIMIQP